MTPIVIKVNKNPFSSGGSKMSEKFVTTQNRILATKRKERSQILTAAIRRYKASYDLAAKQKNVSLMLTSANIIERAEKELKGIVG
jgi:hypothetical protein